jgi:hypothetical protein
MGAEVACSFFSILYLSSLTGKLDNRVTLFLVTHYLLLITVFSIAKNYPLLITLQKRGEKVTY